MAAVDRIIAEEAVDGGTDDMVQWTLTDHLNTVRDIAKYDPLPDATTVVNHLVYDAFANVTRMGSRRREPAVDSLFLFTARPFDADTGLQNNLNRWYDAAVGRWLSEDRVGFEGGDTNIYRYVANSPLTGIDATALARLPRHHWFMAYHSRPNFGQALVNAKCRIPHIEIDRYNSEYTQEQHHFIHRKAGGDIIVVLYEGMYRTLLETSSTCCTFVVGMKALMLAWHSAIRLAQMEGVLPGQVKSFDLIPYQDVAHPPQSTYHEFNQKIVEACGCTPELQDRTNREILKRQLEFLVEIKHTLRLVPPTVGDQLWDMISHPIGAPAPLPGVPVIPKPGGVPVLR